MQCHRLLIMMFLYFFSSHFAMAGGVVIGGTRVVYLSDKKEVSVSVNNLEKESVYLIQSWIQDENEKTKTPFIVTPPLFKLPANNENILRIIKVGSGLPMDRESIFWLNVTSIPETVKSNADVNQLQIVVNSRLKLFYRPTQLEENSGESYKHIKFRKENGVLIAKNSTPYFISLSHLKVDGKEIEGAGMINPFSQSSWSLPVKNAKNVSWKAINDYGGVTQEEFANL
ncbi:molecular chaperone [Xenorhabdus bovienii]|uniref:Putative periplasmic chaperone protein with PapD-like and periplasmic chaperone C-domains n=1 Tax=Xenorhabdus bovienii str. Intermedium TaxID=1379677 RepID=A0A077QM76_XENBV|nr:molecular chaperone [Xenorhabdus bovienii]CDH34649.1 putative periplasmic chaperone protein with PapD-like and periplasmic chaperone C-domains [Xenorhabdus bovienii str. Intermedium]